MRSEVGLSRRRGQPKRGREERLTAICLVFLLSGFPAVGQQEEHGAVAGTIQSVSATEDLVVYLDGISGELRADPDTALMDQQEEVFIPHLLAVQSGQTVRFKNGDPFTHNIHLFRGRRSLFNRAQSIGDNTEWTPSRPGEYLVLCDIHRKMSAYIFVFDHPFFAAVERAPSSAERSFQIEGIPAGTYTLVVLRDQAEKGILKKKKEPVTIVPGRTATVTVQF